MQKNIYTRTVTNYSFNRNTAQIKVNAKTVKQAIANYIHDCKNNSLYCFEVYKNGEPIFTYNNDSKTTLDTIGYNRPTTATIQVDPQKVRILNHNTTKNKCNDILGITEIKVLHTTQN